MTEDFVQFIWRHQLYIKNTFIADTGEKVKVLHPGTFNSNEGPDFYQAKIEIDNTLWIGNCEIHLKASDWYKHKHHENLQFSNIILHVCLNNDATIISCDGRHIPSIELKYNREFEKRFHELIQSKSIIACKNYLPYIASIHKTFLLTRIGIERLKYKCLYIKEILNETKGHWEHCTYRLIFKAFGFNINDLAFERLIMTIPFPVLMKCRNRLITIEALLFGQAGLLSGNYTDEYPNILKQEYLYLKEKYNLTSLEKVIWKFNRTRPANFPTIRLAQLALLIAEYPNFFSIFLTLKNTSQLYKIFTTETSTYWLNHYQFDKPSTQVSKKISKASSDILAINVIIPLIFAYGEETQDAQLKDKAIALMEQIPAENNSIIEKWRRTGILPDNAFESQALIHQYKHYCVSRHCLKCNIFGEIYRNITNED